MDLKPKSFEKIQQLMEKGVNIPNPATIDIGDDVNCNQIWGKGVTIYPGCRIYGGKTVISAGCKVGYEGPVTIEDCQLGEKVELKGGFFSKSVFLEKANLSMGAHVREGCILEEEAGGAHCVGLKQTILFPFVTLGSLINFCDCLMAGGTSRSNHSEVGSSYIHFNFTPEADKTTPSLIGDVPRGVMLNQPPIFLGGQGGMVGPVHMGFGNIVAAGSIVRKNYPGDNHLIFAVGPARSLQLSRQAPYSDIVGVVENNILYLANLVALEAWYRDIRKSFLETHVYGPLLYSGVMEQLASAKKERLKRLKTMAEKAAAQPVRDGEEAQVRTRQDFFRQMDEIEALFSGKKPEVLADTDQSRDAFLEGFHQSVGNGKTNYIEAIQGLPAEVSAKGVMWLSGIVDAMSQKVAQALPSMGLFNK